MPYQKSLILIKPGVRERGIVGRIISRFEDKNLDLCAMKLLKPTKTQMGKHYAEHKKKPFYEELVRYMTSAPLFAFVVGGENAVAACRGLVGATDPRDAHPGSLRGDFAVKLSENVVHASDSVKSATREIKIFFTSSQIM